MVNESIAAELKIRLNRTMTCEDSFFFCSNTTATDKVCQKPTKIQFRKKGATISVNTNQEGSLRVSIVLL